MIEPSNKLYWLGNSAKTKIIKEVLESVRTDEPVIVFDYGCGGGGDWSTILTDYPNLKLIGYEPDKKSFAVAQQQLSGLNAELYTSTQIKDLNFKADYIVSFSVFEHVYDRSTYLETAKKHLSEEGVFFLNYDDGHFRNYLDLNNPKLWFSQLKEWLHNLGAEPLAKLGMISHYQRRVSYQEVEELVKQVGFQVIKSEYSNLASFKALQKTISPVHQQEFATFWSDVESTLNDKFIEEGGKVILGDFTNLWQQMASRTLYLKHRS